MVVDGCWISNKSNAFVPERPENNRSAAIDREISIVTVNRLVRLFEKVNIFRIHDFGDG
jgi:hypothetical protein